MSAAERKRLAIDAALESQGPATYARYSEPVSEAVAAWRAHIEAERLVDIPVDTLHNFTVDIGDGALCRGGGGLAYTPHAWAQLIGLYRAKDIPNNAANVTRWLSPTARSFAFADIVTKAKRKATEKAVLRTFIDRSTGVRALRAVVSARHSLAEFDDSALASVLADVAEHGSTLRVSRSWDMTQGLLDLSKDGDGAELGLYFENSETGCASLAMRGSVRITVLDAHLVMPAGERYARALTVASAGESTRRRHTLPRTNRTSVARERIESDVERALADAALVAAAWAKARVTKLPFAEYACGADVLGDYLMERFPQDVERVKATVETLKDPSTSLHTPMGTVAYLAAAAAASAHRVYSWGDVMNAQTFACRVLLHGLDRAE